MGGIGSGRRSRHNGNPVTSEATPLDVRKIAREGLLVPGSSFSWRWLANGQKVAGISIRVESDQSMLLSFHKRGTDDVVEQRVQTQTSPCHLGGQRYWLTCPKCGKRVAVLYAPGHTFACRLCGGLTYATQKEDAGDRASTRVNKIRRRLGWTTGILNDTGGKPKGMHWATYRQLKSQHDSLLQISLENMGRKLGILNKLLAR